MMGIFLLFVTLVLEALGGVWSYYFGVHYAAGMAGMLNATFEAWYGTSRAPIHVTTVHIGLLWVVVYVLIHLGAVVGYVKGVAKKRLKMGSPGPREIEAVDRIYRQLATASPPAGFERVSHLRWPGAFKYAPGHGVTLSFLGSRLIIDEGLFTSRYLKPLLAQQLFAWNSGDVWLRVVFACLVPLAVYVMPLCAICGLPLGIGPFLTFLWWKKYWRDRVYAGDRFAVRLGQGPDLIEALDHVVRPRERPENLFVRESPYAGERIGRIERMMPAGYSYSRAYAQAGPSPSGGASWTSGTYRSEQAQRGYAQSETPTSSRSSAASEKTGPSSGPSPQAGQSSYTKKADEPASAPGWRYAEWLRQQAASNAADTTGNRSSSRTSSDEGRANVPDWKYTRGYASSNAQPSGPKRTQRRSAGEKKPPWRKFPSWSPAFTPSVTLILEYADAGWHLRWSTPDTDVFFSVLEEFKARFEYDEYYWDPFAFEKGGWWVAYGALSKVSDLFGNYQAARDALEQEYRKQYEEQVRRNRKRAAREQQEQQTRQQQEHRSGQRQETSSGQRGSKGSQTQQQPPPKREEIKLPRTSQEAYAILSLVPPVTLAEVRRAYRAKARECHPDHGGSHAQMVVINAAFELIQKVVA
jgi:FtsZ-interacting cell division protein YlmF